jgi:hypothetical protein
MTLDEELLELARRAGLLRVHAKLAVLVCPHGLAKLGPA